MQWRRSAWTFAACVLALTGSLCRAEENALEAGDDYVEIADPLAPLNRAFFHFNEKLYYWILKPVARGYGRVLPERARGRIRNAFENLRMPKRCLNALLQGDFRGSGTELARFGVNTTVGVLGLGDPAGKALGLKPRREDTGQTLGLYGVGGGVYLNWPVWGPSNLRDTVGMVADSLLDPLLYLIPDPSGRIGVRAGERLNSVSLRIGEYEALTDDALDPYTAIKDAYTQRRVYLIRERGPGARGPAGILTVLPWIGGRP